MSLSGILVLSAGLCVFLAFAGAFRRRAPGARSFSLLMIASAVYAAAEAFELSAATLESIMLAVKVEYLGIAVLAPLWLIFTLEFCERPPLPKPVVVLLFVESAFTLIMVWTTERHGLFYSRAWVRSDGPFPLIGLEHGIAYWIHTLVMWAESILGFIVLAAYAYRAPAPVRDSALLPVAGALVNLVSSVLLLMGATPYGIDIGPFGMALAGLAFASAIRGGRFLILPPVARDLVLESMDDALVILDSAGAVVDFNRSAADYLGLAAFPRRRARDARADGAQRELLARALDRPELSAIMASGEGCCNLDLPPAPGELEIRRLRARTFPVKDTHGRPIGACLLLTDVTETAILLDRLAELATIDGLTGALNKRRFGEIGARDFEIARRSDDSLGVVMFDLDHFKLVNDERGHAAGDEVLREVCRRCKRGLRSSDVLGRIGGEEFAVVLPLSDLAGTMAAAERLRQAMAEAPFSWDGCGMTVTVSVGAYNGVPRAGEGFDLFLRRADEALYEAKSAGRNRVVLWSERAKP
jgi:diguanylate cyclase (GGDEF)-like protein